MNRTAGPSVVVVGAGLAGLAAAHAAVEQGADVRLLEQGAAPGGATVQSAGWIWRYRDRDCARRLAPHADEVVRDVIVDELDAQLAWLERVGVTPRRRASPSPLTRGVRIDPVELVDVLVERLERLAPGSLDVGATLVDARAATDGRGGVQLLVEQVRGAALGDRPRAWIDADAVVFAGGGYATDLARIARESRASRDARGAWVLRATAAGDGSSLDAACALDAATSPATGECLVRLVPDVAGGSVDRALLLQGGELQVAGHRLASIDGELVVAADHDWSGAQRAWTLARTDGRGRVELPRASLLERVPSGGTVEDIVRAAIDAGADAGRCDDGAVWIAVRAGITSTWCGLRVDASGAIRAAVPTGSRDRQGSAGRVSRAWAAGADAASSGLGGTSSGLAQALVLGRRAGHAAATS
jgi:hypothetical protein